MVIELLDELKEDQKKLDSFIIHKKGLTPKANVEEKAIALLVETGELANEWRGFKFWSENQKPKDRENLIKEAVDCLHFFISILNDIEYTGDREEELTEIYGAIHQPSIAGPQALVKNLYKELSLFADRQSEVRLIRALDVFDNLLISLNITKEEMTEYYHGKNQENHERQENGY